MIDKALREKHLVVKVTDDWDDVERLTREGWRLLGTEPSQRVENASREDSWTSPDGYGHGSRLLQTPLVLNVPLFVLGLDEESALARADRDLKASVVDYDKALAERDAARTTLQSMGKELQLLRESNDRFENANRGLAAEEWRLRELSRKLEADVGKIEAEIGAQRMREILGR